MPLIYLSPSTQPYNLYASGGSEQDFMNRLANEMQPLLTASGISYQRKNLSMSAAKAIAASNEGDFDLHLALHSNALPEPVSGTARGIIVFYNPTSSESRRASSLIAEELRKIYPLPKQVRIEPSTSIGEVARVRAPAAFLELGYHDNWDDAVWVSNHSEEIAQAIVRALSSYFQTPFLPPKPARPGRVKIQSGRLNIRARPETSAPLVGQAVNGAALSIVNAYEDWYLVRSGDLLGYAKAQYIQPL